VAFKALRYLSARSGNLRADVAVGQPRAAIRRARPSPCQRAVCGWRVEYKLLVIGRLLLGGGPVGAISEVWHSPWGGPIIFSGDGLRAVEGMPGIRS